MALANAIDPGPLYGRRPAQSPDALVRAHMALVRKIAWHVHGRVASAIEIEDLVLSRLPDLSELAVVHGPDSEPIPVICTHEDKPLDRERWREAVADFPELAEPIQVAEDELPRTATLKVRRLELARRLEEQIKNRA